MVKYGHVKSAEDITRINKLIRQEVRNAQTHPHLTRLVRQSLYLVTLTESPAWKEVGNLASIRRRAKEEYTKTAREANRRMMGRYDTKYGRGT
jgi:hypothetical protein